jgi:hypothetical protein
MASNLESRLARLEREAATQHARAQATVLEVEYQPAADGYPAGEPVVAFLVDPSQPKRGAKAIRLIAESSE